MTENSSPRRMPAAVLAARAAEVLGNDRVTVEPDLSHAIRAALSLAGRADSESTAVLATGSVVTAGKAGVLLRLEISL